MAYPTSPLASPFPAMSPIAGVTPHVVRAGYKDWGRCDLTYVELDEGTAVAGVFTRNLCCSSEVELGRDNVKQGFARALVVNAGNSNAFTGYRGREAWSRSWTRSQRTSAARANRSSSPPPA